MANLMKFTHYDICNQNGCIDRAYNNPNNTEIDLERIYLNYFFSMTYERH